MAFKIMYRDGTKISRPCMKLDDYLLNQVYWKSKETTVKECIFIPADAKHGGV